METSEGGIEVDCTALSFDGGSLICFRDSAMTAVVAAFSPSGWQHCYWKEKVDE